MWRRHWRRCSLNRRQDLVGETGLFKEPEGQAEFIEEFRRQGKLIKELWLHVERRKEFVCRGDLVEFEDDFLAGEYAVGVEGEFMQVQSVIIFGVKQEVVSGDVAEREFDLPGDIDFATGGDGVVEVEPLLQEAETGIGNVGTVGAGVVEGEPAALGMDGAARGIGIGGSRCATGGAVLVNSRAGTGGRIGWFGEPGVGGTARRIGAGYGACLADFMANAARITNAGFAAARGRP